MKLATQSTIMSEAGDCALSIPCRVSRTRAANSRVAVASVPAPLELEASGLGGSIGSPK